MIDTPEIAQTAAQGLMPAHGWRLQLERLGVNWTA